MYNSHPALVFSKNRQECLLLLLTAATRTCCALSLVSLLAASAGGPDYGHSRLALPKYSMYKAPLAVLPKGLCISKTHHSRLTTCAFRVQVGRIVVIVSSKSGRLHICKAHYHRLAARASCFSARATVADRLLPCPAAAAAASIRPAAWPIRPAGSARRAAGRAVRLAPAGCASLPPALHHR